MPKTARVQHTYNHKSGLPEHGIVNTFYFQSPTDTWATDEATDLAQHVIDFYDKPFLTMGSNLRTWIAESTMAPVRHTVKVYDLEDAEPRAPKVTLSTSNTTTNNVVAPMPSEVAVCLSYRGSLISGTSPARRRGRIYLGPLSAGVAIQDGTGFNRPDLAFRTDMLFAARGMAAEALADGWSWVVRSGGGTTGAGAGIEGFVLIEYVWVDDAWDTQRRRGANPTSRTGLALP